MSKDKENRNDQLKAGLSFVGGKLVRVRGFPRAGIKHPVVKLPSYVKMSVTTEEYELVLAHRKADREAQDRGDSFLQARKDAIRAYQNFKA